MTNPFTTPARSARRRIALTFLGVIVALSGSAYAVYAAGGPDFSLSAAPSSQTIGSGQSTGYTVNVARSGGQTATVQLSVSGLPLRSSASFSPSSLSGSQTTSALSVSTSSSTPAGTYTLTVTGKAGSTTHTKTVTLVVVKPDFSISVAPATQTVARGSSTSYTVTVTRTGGFTDSVHLTAVGFVFGASASFSHNDLTPGHDTTTLTVTTSGLTALGAYTIHIIGLSGSLIHTTTTELIVSNPDFSVSAAPPSQTVAQGASTSYTVTVTRTGGFAGAVSLSVSGLPSGATASWSPSSTVGSASTAATLTVQTSSTTPVASSTLHITGSATLPTGAATRSTNVTLVVQTGSASPFSMSGNLAQTLYPGTKAPLNLSLTNPNSVDLKVTSLTVTVASTNKPGCAASTNFTVDQFSGSYPLTIHPGTTSLGSLVADSTKWPQVRMLDLPTSQDACQTAAVSLSYAGSATT